MSIQLQPVRTWLIWGVRQNFEMTWGQRPKFSPRAALASPAAKNSTTYIVLAIVSQSLVTPAMQQKELLIVSFVRFVSPIPYVSCWFNTCSKVQSKPWNYQKLNSNIFWKSLKDKCKTLYSTIFNSCKDIRSLEHIDKLQKFELRW